MASKEFPLSIIIRAIDRATAPIRKITSAIGRLAAKSQKASRSLVKMGKKLTLGLTTPIVGMGIAVGRVFVGWQKGMARANTMMRLSKAELKALSGQALTMATGSAKPLAQITETLFQMASNGVLAADRMRTLKGSTDLAIGGRGSVPQAFAITSSAIKSFRLEGTKAAGVYNKVFKILEEGQLDISTLQQGFGSTAPVVAAVGGTLEDFGASVAAMTKLGLKAPEAMTKIRAAIAGTTKDTPALAKMFKKLGVDGIEQLIKKTGSLGGAFKAIGGSVDFSIQKLKKLLGSDEAVSAVLSVGRTVNDDYAKSLKKIAGSADTLTPAVVGMSRTVAGRTQIMKNKFGKLAVTVGEILLPFMEGLVANLSAAADWFGKLSPSTQKWIVTILALVAAVGPVLFIFGKLTLAFGLLSTALGIVSANFTILKLIMLANPVIAIATAIAVAALLIYTYWGPISGFFERLWKAVKKPFVTFLKVIGLVFFAPFVLAIAAFKGGWSGLKSFFKQLWIDIVNIFQSAMPAILKVVKWTIKAGETVWKSTKSLVKTFTGGREDFDGNEFSDPAAAFAQAQAAAIPIPRNPGAGLANNGPGGRGSGGLLEILFKNAPAGMRAEAKRGSDGSTPNVGLQTDYGLHE